MTTAKINNKLEATKMRYPEHNATLLDTGIRMIDIMALVGEDAKAAGGEYAVALCKLTRRADAATTERDIWDWDKSNGRYLFVGLVDDCIAYIANHSVPCNGRLMYNAQGKMIWADIPTEHAYLDMLKPLCNDGEMLGAMLNYAAVVKNGYAPYAPGYDPDKRPVV